MNKGYIVITAKDTTKRLERQELNQSVERVSDTAIYVDTNQRFQKMVGFGGAFTEASAYTLSCVSEDKRNEVIKAYFNRENGLNYSIGRVHIHSCDFALGNYTYVEDYDHELKTFDISHDFKWVIPLIKDAMKERGEAIQILASPWSPPAWMKSNNEMNHGGKLLPEYFDAWANYYVKFIKAYREAGIPIDSITVQNEPAAVQVWDSCIYTAEEERDFIKNHLGPTLVKAGLGDIKLYIWDHNRDIIVERAKTVLEDPEAAKYVYGTGLHWYVSEEFEKVGKVHELFPDKHILFTEGCQEGGVHIGAWHTGERYGRNMIGDINNWCEGYLDWNICLNETGGPNHVNNLCDAPIIVNTQNNEVIYNSSYYYIGHFSKYVQPGAYRVGCSVNDDQLLTTAFINPNGEKVVIVMNQTEQNITYDLNIDGDIFNQTILPHSIHTIGLTNKE